MNTKKQHIGFKGMYQWFYQVAALLIVITQCVKFV